MKQYAKPAETQLLFRGGLLYSAPKHNWAVLLLFYSQMAVMDWLIQELLQRSAIAISIFDLRSFILRWIRMLMTIFDLIPTFVLAIFEEVTNRSLKICILILTRWRFFS